MKSPCELIVWHLLPAIRSELAHELKTDRFKQNEIAQKLGITPAAVSQYMSEKRGSDFKFSDDVNGLIKGIAKRIACEDLSEFEIMEEMCVICLAVRKEGMLCKIHHKAEPDIPEKCGYWGKIEKCMGSH